MRLKLPVLDLELHHAVDDLGVFGSPGIINAGRLLHVTLGAVDQASGFFASLVL